MSKITIVKINPRIKFRVGDKVWAGTGEDYDTGTVREVSKNQVTVAWSNGTRTTQHYSILNKNPRNRSKKRRVKISHARKNPPERRKKVTRQSHPTWHRRNRKYVIELLCRRGDKFYYMYFKKMHPTTFSKSRENAEHYPNESFAKMEAKKIIHHLPSYVYSARVVPA